MVVRSRADRGRRRGRSPGPLRAPDAPPMLAHGRAAFHTPGTQVVARLRPLALAGCVALVGCGTVATSGPGQDSGGSSSARASSVSSTSSSTHTATSHGRVDAGGPGDAGRHDVSRPADASARYDAACVSTCMTNQACQDSCPASPGVLECCDTTTTSCFRSFATSCPAPSTGFDAGGPCTTSCKSAADCNSTCPQEFEVGYCCDVSTGQCFVAEDGPTCPLNGLGCPTGGCPAGQMCLYNFLGPDPPIEPVASCYALPASCTHNPTCSCLLTAGVCDAGGGGPSCAADAGLYVACFGGF